MKVYQFFAIVGGMFVGIWSYLMAKELIPPDFAWNPLPSIFQKPIGNDTLSLVIMLVIFCIGYITTGRIMALYQVRKQEEDSSGKLNK